MEMTKENQGNEIIEKKPKKFWEKMQNPFFQKPDYQKMALENNNYYTAYRERLKRKIIAGGKNFEFWSFLDESYFYTFSQRKHYEKKHFRSEINIIVISFLITVVNALNIAMALNGIGDSYRWMIAFLGTVLSGYMTFIQAIASKRKYHECWTRHNTNYILLLKECRDFAEDMGCYSKEPGAVIDEAALLRRFIIRIHEIEDKDLDAFGENTKKLK